MNRWIAVLEQTGSLKPGVYCRSVCIDKTEGVAYVKPTGKTTAVIPLLQVFVTENQAIKCFASHGTEKWYFLSDVYTDGELVVGHGCVHRGFLNGWMRTVVSDPPKGIGTHPWSLRVFNTEEECMKAWSKHLRALEKRARDAVSKEQDRLAQVVTAQRKVPRQFRAEEEKDNVRHIRRTFDRR